MLGRLLRSLVGPSAPALRLCPVCRSTPRRFSPIHPSFREQSIRYGFPYFDDAETLNQEEYICADCGAFDRVRLYVLYLDEALAEVPADQPVRLLHVAPEIGFEHWLARYPNVRRTTLNVTPGAAQIHADICAMPEIASESFDVLICSHVLEHVADDHAAMTELARVLVPGGWGIIMVPLYPERVLVTDEDPLEPSAQERVRRFGQKNHVRLYAKRDFLMRLASAGFRVECLGREYFGADVLTHCGIGPGSVLYVVRKPGLDPAPGAQSGRST